MKTKMMKTAAAALMALALTSCGTFMQVGGGYADYNDGYNDGYYDGSLLSYSDARSQALYLSDKMAYELGLNAAQYDAVYEINFDYLTNLRQYNDLYGSYWARRNSDLRYVLSANQYSYYTGANYFYRPIGYSNNVVVYNIYNRYNNPDYYYYVRPDNYDTYRGGHNRAKTSYYSNRKFGGRKSIQRNNGSVQFGSAQSRSANTNTATGGNRTFGGRSTQTQTTTSRSTQPTGTFGNGSRSTSSRSNSSANRQSTQRQTSTTRQSSSSTSSSNRSFGSRSTATQGSSTTRQTTTRQTTTRQSTTPRSSSTTTSSGHR